MFDPEVVTKLLEDVLGNCPEGAVKSIYLSGSQIEGFANDSSDLDVYAVVTSPPRRFLARSEMRFVDVRTIGGVRTDTEYHLGEWVEALVSRVASYSLNAEEYPDVLNSLEADFLHRFMIGQVIFGHDYVSGLLGPISGGKGKMALTVRAMSLADNAYEDAVGMYSGQDFEASAWMSRHAMELAMDALLASHAQTNPGAKWRLHKLRRALTPDDEMRKRFVQLDIGPYEGSLKLYTEQCLEVAQAASILAQEEL